MGGKENKEYLILSECRLHACHSGSVPVKTLLTASLVANKEENFLSTSAASDSLNQLENWTYYAHNIQINTPNYKTSKKKTVEKIESRTEYLKLN
jgi:hypothetical protein